MAKACQTEKSIQTLHHRVRHVPELPCFSKIIIGQLVALKKAQKAMALYIHTHIKGRHATYMVGKKKMEWKKERGEENEPESCSTDWEEGGRRGQSQ